MANADNTEHNKHNPSFAELAATFKALQQPSEPQGLAKHVTTIVVASSLGIGAWVLSSLNSVQNTLIRVDTTMSQVQTTTEDMSRRVDSVAIKQADMQAKLATLEQRIDMLEAPMTRK